MRKMARGNVMNSIGADAESNRLATRAAGSILGSFEAFHATFTAITGRARLRFEQRDWHGAQRDAAERLTVYKDQVDAALARVRGDLQTRVTDVRTWECVRGLYSAAIAARPDYEVAESFFNSVSRRIFSTVGVNPHVEFVRSEIPSLCPVEPPIFRTYRCTGPAAPSTPVLVHRILSAFPWRPGYRDLGGDAARAAAAIDDRMRPVWGDAGPEAVDVVQSVFYRNKGAYVVGRLRRGEGIIPLVFALASTPEGIAVDAVLLTVDEASIVFGFSWSYFRVACQRPRALVDFLTSIMPHKRIDELYTSIGFNKHGKTELYRSLIEHLRDPNATFEIAEGEEGLVMDVFTLPSFNVVFKVIKDAFGEPKRTTRRAVMDKYHLIFVHDRVGRLADAQEFEHLEFQRDRFAPALLARLLRTAPSTVRVTGERVIVAHLYTERRVTPLNVYLKEAGAARAREAIVDYGNAIRDLAAANIFTGDMLLKNCGVTRHGRVVFYDYDEMALLTECNVRRIPAPVALEDELAAEPWFHVGENDIFPEEFRSFLVPAGALQDVFLDAHAELLTVDYWTGIQERVRAGELFDVFPYPLSRRLSHA
jgi:isocitrate dehydrogenase kinase/phosphatase